MSRKKLKVAVGLLKGHKTLTAHIFKLGLTKAGLPALQGRKEDSVHILHQTFEDGPDRGFRNVGKT
jgi:hypothetical protein